MADVIRHKRSSVASAVPAAGQLQLGELAVNVADGKLFLKKTDGSVVSIGGPQMVLVEKRQIITASATWHRPPGLLVGPFLTGIGGGASGNSTGTAGQRQGGGGGQWVFDLLIDIGATTSVAVTIGTGGAATSPGSTTGNAGGTTSFGSFLSLLGAPAPTTSVASPVGAPGFFDGATGRLGGSTPFGQGGITTTSQAGPGGAGIVIDASGTKGGSSTACTAAQGYGAGGCSSINGSTQGQSGADGVLIVRWMEAISV